MSIQSVHCNPIGDSLGRVLLLLTGFLSLLVMGTTVPLRIIIIATTPKGVVSGSPALSNRRLDSPTHRSSFSSWISEKD
jgi:hypothetical protein